ncbi:hypothetical protein BS78_01G127900 [Paspalum vaginatum]|nr:hypothetical protein BS78_01G127900 [Paspalum vaginatum]KAJ1294204.1 hypothetical protein BS78_01G127900 [Paspalum vaginatum]KAJ1294205.1 hypothetical protein BS78_01G127900 [Paspalum vaginatum]KAJ1294206.1 hypothetical protein BS78_01G127900 [Paspalum vaginatum]
MAGLHPCDGHRTQLTHAVNWGIDSLHKRRAVELYPRRPVRRNWFLPIRPLQVRFALQQFAAAVHVPSVQALLLRAMRQATTQEIQRRPTQEFQRRPAR